MKVWCLVLPLLLCFACSPQKPTSTVENKNQDPQNIPVDVFAKFLSLEGEVEYKRKGHVTWNGAQSDSPLFLKDWVKTNASSLCQIEVARSSQIDMSENSVIVLLEKNHTDQKKQTVLGFSRGEVKGEVYPSSDQDHELLFKLPNAWVVIKSSLKEGVKKIFRMSLNQGKMKIHAQKGDLEIQWNRQSLKLEEKESYEADVPMLSENDQPEFIQTPVRPRVEKVDKPLEAKPKEQETNKAQDGDQPTPKKQEASEKRPVVKTFAITFPPDKFKTSEDQITIEGKIPPGVKVYLRGEKIAVTKRAQFSKTFPLDPGINIFTFQIVKPNKIEYQSIEVTRQ